MKKIQNSLWCLNASLIFSLINKKNDPFKAKRTDNRYAIFGHSSFGPIYKVSGNDFLISSNSNTNEESCSNFGQTYKHGTYGNTIAGSKNFQTSRVEVYKKLCIIWIRLILIFFVA